MVLNNKITEVGQSGKALSEMIGRDSVLDFDYYNSFIKEHLQDSNMAFGMGYWFEPYYTGPETKYFGPYLYKNDEGESVYTMMYSTEDYDYFSWDWYAASMASDEICHLTEPYYDELLNTLFTIV